MEKERNKLLLKKDDYDLLLKYVYSRMDAMNADSKNAEQLYRELEDAEVYTAAEGFPKDVVCSNSIVEVEEKFTGRQMRFRLVLPGQANLKGGKLSVLAPLGIALMGYRKGATVNWEMPSGEKQFHIKNVFNPNS